MKSLKVSQLSYAYHRDEFVIKSIEIEFERHKIYTLLGLNGSGKTTLIKLLAGLISPNKGIVYLGERDIKTIGFLERSKHIAYVRQGSNTGDDHFVRDYLSFGMMNQFSWFESPKDEHMQFVNDKAQQFGIAYLLDKKMNELSGGQKQIVMICRAVIQNTEIIILDEPTSALDFKNQSLVLKILKDLVENENKTIILSTHNPNHALYLNSEVVLIHDGRIISYGHSKELISIEQLKKVYGDNIKNSKDLDYNELTIT